MEANLSHSPKLEFDGVKFLAKAILVRGKIIPVDQTDALLLNLSICASCRLHNSGCEGVESLSAPAIVGVSVSDKNIKQELQENPNQEKRIKAAKLLAAEHIRSESSCKPQY